MTTLHADTGVTTAPTPTDRLLDGSLAVAPLLYLAADTTYAVRGWDREVRAVCAAVGITYQGFSLLTANRQVLAHPDVVRTAERLGRSPAQVVFRFALDVGMLPLTGTTDPAHMRADLDVFDFELTDEQMTRIAAMDTGASLFFDHRDPAMVSWLSNRRIHD